MQLTIYADNDWVFEHSGGVVQPTACGDLRKSYYGCNRTARERFKHLAKLTAVDFEREVRRMWGVVGQSTDDGFRTTEDIDVF